MIDALPSTPRWLNNSPSSLLKSIDSIARGDSGTKFITGPRTLGDHSELTQSLGLSAETRGFEARRHEPDTRIEDTLALNSFWGTGGR
jgi:hypothetical protein